PLEWKSAYRLNKQPLPPETPSLNDVLRQIAKLGGFLGRKGDGDPGAKSIWMGLQRIQDCIYGIQLAQELGELA
ncbi:MAG TPA: IS4 family transposase, partial [Rhizobiales bacterium]|nr:IS4 family transposase [Hyphomicrobiales bacterium]